MTWITADFGTDYANLSTVGVAQLQADGSAVVPRTTVGIVHFGAGVYGVDATLDPLTVLVQWDTGTGVYASEEISGSAINPWDDPRALTVAKFLGLK